VRALPPFPIALILAAALVAAPLAAAAQAWKRFAYDDAGFAVQLPAEPVKGQATVHLGSASAPAATWTVKQPDIVYSMTVADVSKLGLAKDAALDQAVKALAAQGKIKVDVTERINSEYGRQLSLLGKDGSRSTLSIFLVGGRLYQLEAKALPPDPQAASAKAARFHQSLEFIG
jgi:hypothetical protein